MSVCLARLFSQHPYGPPLLDSVALGRWLGRGLSLGIIGLTAFACWPRRPLHVALAWEISLVIVGAHPFPGCIIWYFCLSLSLCWLRIFGRADSAGIWWWKETTDKEMEMSVKGSRADNKVLLIVLLLGAWFLLLFKLEAKSLSPDEFGNVLIESGNLAWIFRSMATAWSQHPPVSHLLMHGWIALAGDTDFSVRLPGTFWALLSLLLFYRLGCRYGGAHLGLLAVSCLAIAPDFIMYSRMEKYYMLVVLLSLVYVSLFFRLWREAEGWTRLAYAALGVILLYTDYLASLFLMGVHTLLALICRRKDASWLRKWLPTQVIPPVLFLPFAWVALDQVRSLWGSASADLARGVLAFWLKVAYFFYSYAVGETLFPWHPAAILGLALFACLGLLSLGFFRRLRCPEPGGEALFFLLSYILLPVVGLVLLSLGLLTAVPLITLPNHVLFVLPFFRLLVAGGLARSGSRWPIFLGAVLLVNAFGLYNYYTDSQFHNPVHAMPSKQAVEFVLSAAREGDLIIAEKDSVFPYYYQRRYPENMPYPLLPPFLEEVQDYLRKHEVQRIWLITIGRDRTRASTPTELIEWLEANYTLSQEQGFAEQSADYRRFKELLTHRPAYRYKVKVQLFVSAA